MFAFTSSRSRALLLFVVALVVRASFWLATPDRNLSNAPVYEGDAPKWLAFLLRPEGEIQLELPFHPPGMIWLTGWLTDGESFWFARLVMVLLGALLAPLLYLAVRRSFDECVALLAGGLVALASGLVMLSSGLHSETPYLFLFALGLLPLHRLSERENAGPHAWPALAFGATQAVACYFRVDHLAFVALVLGWLLVRHRRRALLDVAMVVGALAVVLAPWQLHANDMVNRANEQGFAGRAPLALPMPGALPWSEDALAAVRAVPAFARNATFGFVNGTVAHRGGRRVELVDLEILDQAYGYRPGPLATPLIAMYGPMNFALANYEASGGGFTREAFDHRPPLVGGIDAYPPGLRGMLQPNLALSFDYPPHLELINHGYRVALSRMQDQPGQALSLMMRKLQVAWRGAATGFGSYAVPLGMSGVREPVDIAVAQGWLPGSWRTMLAFLALVGLWYARKSPAIWPFVGFVAAKVITVALFFGYARFGAMCVPALALFWAVGAHQLWLSRLSGSSRMRLAWSVLTLVLVIELVRAVTVAAPEVEVAGPVVTGRNQAAFVRY